MKCPICGKDVELQKKQIGASENGDPIFNQYAICRDCKKQWNLDKQRAKKMAAKKAAEKRVEKPVEKTVEKRVEKTAEKPVKKTVEKQAVRKASTPKTAPVKGNPPSDAPTAKKPSRKRPAASDTASNTGKKSAENPALEEQRYANIPPEKVRTKREKAARQGYEDMLAADPEHRPAKKKRTNNDTKAVSRPKPKSKEADPFDSDELKPTRKGAAGRHSSAVNTVRKKPAPEPVEPEDYDYEDDYDYDDTPRFRPVRIILGVLSLLGFAFFIYRGFITGLSSVSSGDGSAVGTTYIVLALCMLVSAMLYLIMQKKNTMLAFLLPMIFYLGSAVFAFLKKGDGLELLIAAVASAVLAVISLILGIFSRGGDDYEDDDYEDPFEDDYED